MFKIEVRNKNGQKVVYEREAILTKDYLDYLELMEKIEPMGQLESYRAQLQFMADLFPGLTVEELANGTTTKEMNDIFARFMVIIVGGESDPKESE